MKLEDRFEQNGCTFGDKLSIRQEKKTKPQNLHLVGPIDHRGTTQN